MRCVSSTNVCHHRRLDKSQVTRGQGRAHVCGSPCTHPYVRQSRTNWLRKNDPDFRILCVLYAPYVPVPVPAPHTVHTCSAVETPCGILVQLCALCRTGGDRTGITGMFAVAVDCTGICTVQFSQDHQPQDQHEDTKLRSLASLIKFKQSYSAERRFQEAFKGSSTSIKVLQ